MSREEQDFKEFMSYLGSDLYGEAYYKYIGTDESSVYAFFLHPLADMPMVIATYYIESDDVSCFEYVHVRKHSHVYKIDRRDEPKKEDTFDEIVDMLLAKLGKKSLMINKELK